MGLRRSVAVLATMVVLAASAIACSVPVAGDMPAVLTDHAAVPSIPIAPLASMRVVPAAIEDAACDECERSGGDRDRFFSGRLALGSLDALIASPASPERAALGGNLFVSGYLGGLQLRSVLGSLGVPDAGPAAPLLELVGRSTAPALDGLVGDLQRVAAEGDDAAVRSTATGLLPLLVALYGYNLGYLRVLLDHPPAGVTPAGDRIECPTRWSCRTPALGLGEAERFDASFGRLAAPPDASWALVAAVASALLDASEPAGAGVWDRLLADDGFEPAGYEAIVDLSGAFLQVSAVALAGTAEAAAGGDVGLSRRALAATAGLVVWAGSYFLGLASPLADSSLPALTCG